MKNLLLVLATSALLAASTDAAVATCGDEMCDIPLENMTCQQAVDAYEFAGTCCSLVDGDATGSNSNCRVLITNGYCSWKEKGSDGLSCTEYPDGSMGCVISSTQFGSSSTDACPVSIYQTPSTSIEPDILYTATKSPQIAMHSAAKVKQQQKKKRQALRGQMMGGKKYT